MFKNRIALKLTAGFVVIVLVSMLTIGIVFMQIFRQYAFNSREQTMLSSARSIAGVVEEYTQSNSANSANSPNPIRGFGGYMRSLDILTESKVWIVDSKGNPVIISGMGQGMGMGMGFGQGFGLRQGQGQGKGNGNGQQGQGMGAGTGQALWRNTDPLPEEARKVIQEILSGKESISESFSSVYNEATITVGVPFFDPNHGVMGAVLLHSPVTGVMATLTKAASILAISLLAALILAAALGIFYSLLFTRPLKAMNQAALEITRGNYAARTGVQRRDELGQLGNSLDHLASELGSTINQLFQEKGKLNDIIVSISEGIVAFDICRKPMSVNSVLSEILNRSYPYQPEELERDLNELGVGTPLNKAIIEKKPVQVIKDWYGKKLKFVFSPILDNNGTVTGSVALVQDISESERLEQIRRDFVANISHEFRTPLTVIRGSLEALLDGTLADSTEIQRFYQRMFSETRGLERLVGDLLELSRLQSGKITLNKEPLHIASLLEDAVKSMQTIAEKKGIKIKFQSERDVPPFIGDYDRIRQLFVIFLDNAIKYSPDNTKVSVETSIQDGNTLSVKIRDQGYGIAAEELKQIWDRFYKIDKSRNGKGTGLGMAIAKHLLELHDGKVFVQSELHKGTVVEVKFNINYVYEHSES
jgi:Signal transduction histidine kinase